MAKSQDSFNFKWKVIAALPNKLNQPDDDIDANVFLWQ